MANPTGYRASLAEDRLAPENRPVRSGRLSGGRKIALTVLAIAAFVTATIATMGIFGVGIAAIVTLPLIAKVTLVIVSALIARIAAVATMVKREETVPERERGGISCRLSKIREI